MRGAGDTEQLGILPKGTQSVKGGPRLCLESPCPTVKPPLSPGSLNGEVGMSFHNLSGLEEEPGVSMLTRSKRPAGGSGGSPAEPTGG